MDIFLKVLLLVIGAAFAFVGFRFFFRSKKIVQGFQKLKYHQIGEPRKQETTMVKIMGILLMLVGLYYVFVSILGLLSL